VVDTATWRPIAAGVNLVLSSGLSSAHAEVGPMRPDWAEQFEQRGIRVTQDVLRDEAIEVFRRYGERSDTLVYNARGVAADNRGS